LIERNSGLGDPLLLEELVSILKAPDPTVCCVSYNIKMLFVTPHSARLNCSGRGRRGVASVSHYDATRKLPGGTSLTSNDKEETNNEL
jgi:hypothetical protein